MFSFILEVFSSLLYLALHVYGPGAFPPALSSEEELRLLKLKEEGDVSAKNKLIEHNLRLVAHVIKKYYSNSSDQDDLISIGTIGLIKAVSTFRTDKGIRLATYAARCIGNEILMYFRAGKKFSGEVHFSDPIDTDKDGNALTLIDVIADDTNIADDIDKKMKIERLKSLINVCLDERECEIVKFRYGILGYPELTQKQVAERLNISRSYVSRIEKSALAKLRRNL